MSMCGLTVGGGNVESSSQCKNRSRVCQWVTCLAIRKAAVPMRITFSLGYLPNVLPFVSQLIICNGFICSAVALHVRKWCQFICVCVPVL